MGLTIRVENKGKMFDQFTSLRNLHLTEACRPHPSSGRTFVCVDMDKT